MFVCLWTAVICGGSSGGARRQAAVMALFLTGMINDGALAANGPDETRCYRRHRGKEEGGRGGGGALGAAARALCLSVFGQGTERLSWFCKHRTTLTGISLRGRRGV